MGPGTTVDRNAAGTRTLEIEQAIFTSVRSPMGSGYRIVAASAGLAADEKREIVRCAPSHGNLCDASPAGTGLASFVLGTGRRCIFLSQNAGAEHTARGGLRVHTHVLVMDPAAYRDLLADPLAIQTAAQTALADELSGKPPTRLDALRWPAARDDRGGDEDNPPALPAADIERLSSVLTAVLDERRLLVGDAPRARQMLRRLLDALPVAIRERLAVSYGLKFAPTRLFDLSFADVERADTLQLARQHGLDVTKWASAPAPADSSFAVWLGFVRRQWRSQRPTDLRRLSNQITHEQTATELGQIATLYADAEQVPEADASLLNELLRRHPLGAASGETCARLRRRLVDAIEVRQTVLAEAEQEAARAAAAEASGDSND